MSESLDPELARALQAPARLVRADPALLDLVRDAGSPARSELLTLSSDAATPEDRYAAAAMMAALFGDRGPLDQAARGYGGAPPRELVALAEVRALRPALRESLASPILTGLLEWATKPDPAAPPLELAMAARDLELSDSSVLRSVASRADQVAQQGARPGQKAPLARFSEVLRHAADAGPGYEAPADRHPASAPHRPVTEETVPPPAATVGPEVTTTGIPASELLSEDEKHEPDPYGTDYPGTGVPVRDSISGPRTDVDVPSPSSEPVRPPLDADAPAAPPPRELSTNELYYGVGSDRYANRAPDGEETRAEERHVVRNWAITFGVIVVILLLLILLM